jgi:hypothetical protein
VKSFAAVVEAVSALEDPFLDLGKFTDFLALRGRPLSFSDLQNHWQEFEQDLVWDSGARLWRVVDRK